MILAAIDGRSAAGKSTLADQLVRDQGAVVFHMDDYFLPRDKRQPGIAGNMDLMRFRKEVLEPLCQGRAAVTRRFDCSVQQLGPEERTEPADLVIVEGAYSLHPLLRDFYDFRVFMDVDPVRQKERILQRGGPEKARQFQEIWIPREEAYLEACHVKEQCDMILET